MSYLAFMGLLPPLPHFLHYSQVSNHSSILLLSWLKPFSGLAFLTQGSLLVSKAVWNLGSASKLTSHNSPLRSYCLQPRLINYFPVCSWHRQTRNFVGPFSRFGSFSYMTWPLGLLSLLQSDWSSPKNNIKSPDSTHFHDSLICFTETNSIPRKSRLVQSSHELPWFSNVSSDCQALVGKPPISFYSKTN